MYTLVPGIVSEPSPLFPESGVVSGLTSGVSGTSGTVSFLSSSAGLSVSSLIFANVSISLIT